MRYRIAAVLALTFLLTPAFVTPTAANPSAHPARAMLPVRTEPQHEGAPHDGPTGYYAMCERAPVLCLADHRATLAPGTGPAHALDQAGWDGLAAVNHGVNARVAAVDDITTYGTSDFWTLARTTGDCEDYMIAKKQALLDRGWAADQLLYAVVDGRQTRYHAVLIVRTDRGDFVLDNLTDQIVGWQASGYRFVVRQSAENPLDWVHLIETDPASAAQLAMLSATEPKRITTR